jgi:crotonobetainyl-CoA:carnitine CoA-transferase CaiB-like acyl-CoA transferase
MVNMALPNKLSGGARRDFRPAPKLGQHSAEILREAGFSDHDIEAMIASRTTLDGRPGKG